MNVYEIVTNRIMDLLSQGEIPWKKPWRSASGPRNLISKKAYQGINQFLLNCSPYASPYWLTFKQCIEKNGHVRKGEKSSLVVFWKWIDRKEDSEQGTHAESSNTGKVPLLRYYNVFNLDQTDGIAPPPDEPVTHPFSPIKAAEQIIQHMPQKPDIRFGGSRAYYSPPSDYIQLPPQEAFHSPEEFYNTALHELCHATGHHTRLARKGIVDPSYFGSHAYSQEELVAEFGASMLCANAGIEQQTLRNSAAYIQGWLTVLKHDKRLAIIAAGQAQKAADFILGRKEDTHEPAVIE